MNMRKDVYKRQHKVTVDRQQLIGALRRVSIFSSQASSLIKLRMQENQIVISAQDIDFSTSAEETQVCPSSGAAVYKRQIPH